MANESSRFFFWYRRYKVRAVDMTDFQAAMVGAARGLSEGTFGAVVLKGFDVAPVSGMVVSVGAGIASGPSGYLNVINSSTMVDLSAATGALPNRSLVVVRATPTDSNFIPSPTNPFNPVPLYSLQTSSIVLISGTPSLNPDYPAASGNDVVLCGVRLAAGASGVTVEDLDFERRDSAGLNSILFRNTQHYDSRLQPYRFSPTSVGVKSSQSGDSNSILLSYAGRSSPSRFPLAGGVHNDDDSFVDFSTGVISGGDTTSPPFTPTIPTLANSIVGLLCMNTDDTLTAFYGDEGTYAQCVDGIKAQKASGAGSVPQAFGLFPIAYVIVSSVGGTFSDVQVIDARPAGGVGQAGGPQPIFIQEVPSGTVNGVNDTFVLTRDPKDAGSLLVVVDGLSIPSSEYTLTDDTITFNAGSIPASGQSVYAYYIAESDNQFSGFQEVPTGAVDGVNATFALTTQPPNRASTLVFVDGVLAEKDEWDLIQGQTTGSIRFTAGSVPQIGQEIYVFYFIQAASFFPSFTGGGGGGGGGGSSGYVVYGSTGTPLNITAAGGIASTGDQRALMFLKSSGGVVPITANPQITAGTVIGQELRLVGTSDVNAPELSDGNGLLIIGPIVLGLGIVIDLYWNGSVWADAGRDN